MDGRSAKPQFGLSGDCDIDKQAQHMHHYRSAAQRGHHLTHIRQLRHCATGTSEYLSYTLPLLESSFDKAVAAPYFYGNNNPNRNINHTETIHTTNLVEKVPPVREVSPSYIAR